MKKYSGNEIKNENLATFQNLSLPQSITEDKIDSNKELIDKPKNKVEKSISLNQSSQNLDKEKKE